MHLLKVRKEVLVSPKVSFLFKNETFFPQYFASYNTFDTPIQANNSALSYLIEDTLIIKRDITNRGFSGLNEGETSVIIHFGSLSDTIYFVVKGDTSNITTSVFSPYPLDKNENFLLFPNPCSNLCFFEYNSEHRDQATILIINLLGQTVFLTNTLFESGLNSIPLKVVFLN